MKCIALLGLSSLFFATAALAAPSSSTNYVIINDTADSAGGRVSSAN